MASKAERIVAGLGGADNIVEIEPCITRLRTEVSNGALVNEEALKAAGAHGVLQGRQHRAGHRRPGGGHARERHRGPSLVNVTAPLAGTAVPLSEVPDPVFAGRDRRPRRRDPARSGRPDRHRTDRRRAAQGEAARVRGGLAGRPRRARPPRHRHGLARTATASRSWPPKGAPVAIGDPVIEWDPVAVAAAGLSAICPVVALDADRCRSTRPAGRVARRRVRLHLGLITR